jgi:hypothetical protein|nr:MAG TPA: hypothetical protein [Caudoviricetes sp.]
MIYKNIYDFQVMETIKRGEKVYCTDKRNKKIFELNERTVNSVFELLGMAEKESGSNRMEFFTEVNS